MAFLPLYGARIMNINIIQIIICHFIWTQVGLGIGATTYSSGALIILKMEMGDQIYTNDCVCYSGILPFKVSRKQKKAIESRR